MVIEKEFSGTAEAQEEQVRELLQRVGRVMLEPAFQQIANRTPPPRCCGQSMKNYGLRTITLMTTCGEVIVQRRRYRCRCRDCGHELHPADAELCTGKPRVSKPLAKRVCQLATVEHFTRLPALMLSQHGVPLCQETMLELAHDVSGDSEDRRPECCGGLGSRGPPRDRPQRPMEQFLEHRLSQNLNAPQLTIAPQRKSRIGPDR